MLKPGTDNDDDSNSKKYHIVCRYGYKLICVDEQ